VSTIVTRAEQPVLPAGVLAAELRRRFEFEATLAEMARDASLNDPTYRESRAYWRGVVAAYRDAIDELDRAFPTPPAVADADVDACPF